MDIWKERLLQERKNWRKNHPFGFIAKPIKDGNDEINLYKWKWIIPGTKDTIWDGAQLQLFMEFSEEYFYLIWWIKLLNFEYPNKPPKCQFVPPLPHPNIYPSGTVCLSILSEDEDWKPSITIPTILKGIQDLLDNPNADSPAQLNALKSYTENREEYEKNIRDYVLSSIQNNK